MNEDGPGSGAGDRGDATATGPAPVRPVERLAAEVTAASEQLAGIAGLPPENVRMESAPRRGACAEGDDDSHYTMRHVWSLADSPEADLARAMDRLRSGLPEHGWSVVMYERNSSPAAELELRAERPSDGLFAYALFMDAANEAPGHEVSKILVTTFTGCFGLPELERR
ncbi:hypothetical protein [Streptomyces sp. SM12]|uniref:hypothetical protein n=1 Tax=Streptomyces sp. SM12 TaxID=1071602 RepID=UPI0011B0CD64|nr:hypothetical protein [Streptomyces sp. SM12]